MRTTLFLACFATALFLSPVQAGTPYTSFLTGQDLSALCNTFGKTDWKEGMCKGIILGTIMRSPVRFCLPETNSMDALYSGILRFLSERPDLLHRPLPQVVDEALSKQFPCGDGG